MNQYKIGDTVWTRKRGKGRIVLDHYEHTGYRPFRVKFNCNPARWYAPKAENLYPSEAAMKLDVANKALCDIYLVPRKKHSECGGWREFLEGKPRVTINMSDLIEIKPDPIQPKFKVGDAVYLRGGKWTVSERYWSGTEYRYNVSRPITPDSDNLLAGIQESDLRYWKETVLTHKLAGTHLIQKVGNGDGFFNHALYTKLRYIGKCELNDLFAAENAKWNTIIFLGQRGDDI